MHFHRPQTLEDALACIADHPARILAGGTDIFPSLGRSPVGEPILDLGRIEALCGISCRDGVWRIGAMTTWAQIAKTDLPAQFDGLRGAAREVGSIQIQNAGTIAGNLCNASPAADGVPPLLSLDADVELSGRAGTRILPLRDFITGVRKVALEPGEIVSAILVPDRAGTRASFLKLGARRYLVISIAMVAVAFDLDAGGAISRAAVAVGSCSAVAARLGSLEAKLVGCKPDAAALSDLLCDEPFAELSPIDDVRASASYRREAVRELVVRAIVAAAKGGA
ncbi:FAD binding domain-containing protein [Breoghania sp.]|uniref:FAD binding domain-containing protein n=1 Tax=Breoghania sp. TaxID=2065378 RepID=UPI002AAB2DA9|nr:FAD binding domain-containing protein [Breoghania sp.]